MAVTSAALTQACAPSVQDLHCTVQWGRLGYRDTWRRTPTSILQRLLHAWRPTPAWFGMRDATDAPVSTLRPLHQGSLHHCFPDAGVMLGIEAPMSFQLVHDIHTCMENG